MDFREWPSNSKTMSLQQVSSSEGSSKMVRDGDSVRFHDDDNNNFDEKGIKSNPDTIASKERDGKKRVSRNVKKKYGIFSIEYAFFLALPSMKQIVDSNTLFHYDSMFDVMVDAPCKANEALH